MENIDSGGPDHEVSKEKRDSIKKCGLEFILGIFAKNLAVFCFEILYEVELKSNRIINLM